MSDLVKKLNFDLRLLGNKINKSVQLKLKGDLKNLKGNFSVKFLNESDTAGHFGISVQEEEGLKYLNSDLNLVEWPDCCARKDLAFHLRGETIKVHADDQLHYEFRCVYMVEHITSIELGGESDWVEEIELKFERVEPDVGLEF